MYKPTMTATDDALEQQRDDAAALDRFLAEVSERAFHVAWGALWEREAALDVVQESMLKLVEYYRGRPAQQWPALFRSILNSKINDQRRRRLLTRGKYKLLSLTGLGLAAEETAPTLEAALPAAQRDDGISAPEAESHGELLRENIRQAMARLPARQRQVFLLREQQGLSIRETADTLGCSDNSVKQHHFRAMRALREQLAEVWEHE